MTVKPTVYLTVGPSASGKTTWANSLNIADVNRDDIRRAEFQFENWKDYKFTKSNENRVTEIQNQLIEDITNLRVDFVISDTNLNEAYRNNMIQKLEEKGYQVELVLFDELFHVLVQRDKKRYREVGADIIQTQFLKMQEQFYPERIYQRDYSLPKAVLFDIDGTLAIMGDRSPFDWANVGIDTPNHNVVDLFKMIRQCHPDWKIITVSGRDGVCWDESTDWIEKYVGRPDGHFQRTPGDMRKDCIVKKEIFDNHIKNNYCVMYVVDDRQQVVDMWHNAGVEVWQVQQTKV